MEMDGYTRHLMARAKAWLDLQHTCLKAPPIARSAAAVSCSLFGIQQVVRLPVVYPINTGDY